MAEKYISISGAREHNLKGIELRIPKGKLTVFTGVSGSGKSSLAFDTLFAEGQRRYVESLSAYARQFLGQMEKPKYDKISGLTPTISIEQKSASSNPRSTVGTITEIYDHLRVLFARAGRQHCHQCGRSVGHQDVPQMVRSALELPEGSRVLLLAPLVVQRKGAHREVLEKALKEGFIRARVDGELMEISKPPTLNKKVKHDIEVLVDRLVIRPAVKARLTDSLETALKLGEGRVVISVLDGGESTLSERNFCEYCNISYPELSPQLFSFNSPLGMCQECNGLGIVLRMDPDKVVPDPSLSVLEGAIAPYANITSTPGSWNMDIFRGIARTFGIELSTPWSQLSKKHKDILLSGSRKKVKITWQRSRGKGEFDMPHEGILNTLMRRFKETKSEGMRNYYQNYMSSKACEACEGTRLRPEARAVQVGGGTLPGLTSKTIKEVIAFIDTLELDRTDRQIAGELLKEIHNRCRFLVNVGLDYLSLDRTGFTLSGGESQRIRLASQLGTELTGVTYILDEPSIGLHQRDNRRLLETLTALRDLDNTVVVVEHDRDTMLNANHVVDFGPGAGRKGGEIVFSGTPKQLMYARDSLTGHYLSGKRTIPMPAKRRQGKGVLTVRGARANNLKNIDVAFPLGVFTVVTGVSGAGKSTLVNEILFPALARTLNRTAASPGAFDGLEGAEELDKVIEIDQKPIGRTPRSNPATYTKVFDHVRKIFVQTEAARMYGYQPGRFSFNVKGGRCEHCSGDGSLKIEMHFLPDVYVTCPECKGQRFNEATLKVRFKGKNISDVLDMTVDEALEVFENHRAVKRIMDTLQAVGLGYLQLGQPSPTLSGGEAQRIKLSRELAKPGTGRTAYILDEPTTGLHFDDIVKLLKVVQELVDRGNTVIMIEHNLDVIKCADYIIDLGPEGGEGGGYQVAVGTPETVRESAGSYTGQFLKAEL